MTPDIRSVGRGPGGRRYLSSERELWLLGVCFWFRLFNVAPETTARFSYLDDRSRSQSPPLSWVADRLDRPMQSTACPRPALPGPAAVGTSPHPAADLLGGAGGLLLGVAGLEQVALVVEATALGQGELHLCLPVPEVERHRDQRQRLLLGLADELVDLGPVQQQLAFAVGVVGPEAGGELPRRDVHLEEPDLAVVDPRVGLVELGLAAAEGLDLRSQQHDPRL